MRDYCTMFPERWEDIEIGQSCCKQHDIEVGEAGTYNPVTPHINFYNCLKNRGISFKSRLPIALAAAIGSLVRYPYFVYRKYMYRRML